jgi:hypothetical protein
MVIIKLLHKLILKLKRNFESFRDYIKKKEIIEKFAEDYLNLFLSKEKEKQNKNESGYLANLAMKALENLKVKINKIHIRYEDQIS